MASTSDKTNAILYNSQQYTQSIGVFRSSEVETKGKKDIKFDFSLDNKSIVELQIISEVTSPILHGTMIYTDKSLDTIPNLIPDNYTFLNFSIERLGDKSGKQIDEAFAHNFVIENVQLFDIKKGEYIITFKSTYWFIFNNYTLYSSIDQKKAYTKMLYDMLNLNSDFINVNSDYRDTVKRGNFMTHCNMTLLESTYELLRSSSDEENGFFFLQYNPTRNTFFIRDIKTQFKNYAEAAKSFNAFVLETDKNSTEARAFVARGITSMKELTIEEYTEYIKDFTITKFDYNKREFTEKNYNINNIKNHFPKRSSKEFLVEYKSPPNAIPNSVRRNKGEKLSISFSDNKMYDALFLLGNSAKFVSGGRLDRKAGDVVALDVSTNDYYEYKFKGNWFIGSIHHVFKPSDNSYQNIYMVSRHENNRKMDKNEN